MSNYVNPPIWTRPAYYCTKAHCAQERCNEALENIRVNPTDLVRYKFVGVRFDLIVIWYLAFLFFGLINNLLSLDECLDFLKVTIDREHSEGTSESILCRDAKVVARKRCLPFYVSHLWIFFVNFFRCKPVRSI